MAPVNIDMMTCRDGVTKASEIFSEYGDFIYAVIRFQSGNDPHAGDLFQDFFLSVAFSPPPPDVRNIKTYLYGAIIHCVADAARRLDNYHGRVHRYADGFEYIPAEDRPENILIDMEEADKILNLIRLRLRRSEAEAITLRYWKGNNLEKVAKKLHVDTRTVSRYISRGLSKVRRFLDAEECS